MYRPLRLNGNETRTEPQSEAPARGLMGIAARVTERPLADHLCALRAPALKLYTFDVEQSESSFSFPG